MKIYDLPYLLIVFYLLCSGCSGTQEIIGNSPDFEVSADTIRFAVIGDYGYTGIPELKVSEMVKNLNPDFVLSTGDNNYYYGLRSTLKENISQYYCDYIYNPDAPEDLQCTGKAYLEKQNRFFPTPGNHDYDLNFKNDAYFEYFTLPGNEENYDFIWGPVHFFTINSMKYYESFHLVRQKRWLKEKVTLSESPFKIIFFHQAVYSSGLHGSTEWMQWDFHGWGATAVLNGHDHLFARISVKEEPGFLYFVNGAGGHSMRPCGERPLNTKTIDEFCYDEDFGAMLVTATRDEIIFEFYSISYPDTPVDRYVIYKE